MKNLRGLLTAAWRDFKNPILYSLWLPSLWTFLLIVELLFFASQRRNELGLAARLFEDLVMVLSFLFYSSRGVAIAGQPVYLRMLKSFSLQFFFWWLVCFFSILLFRFLKKKFSGNSP